MKRRQFISLLLIIVLLFQTLNINVHIALAYETDEARQESVQRKFVSDDNGYIKYYVDQKTGGFYIMPSNQSLDENKAPSFGSIQINDEDYIFGGNYPNSSFIVPPIINDGGTCQTVWQINDIYITQYLNIIQNDAESNSYAVYVRYEVDVTDDEVNEITSGSAITEEITSPSGIAPSEPFIQGRILIDTLFGSEDNMPVTVSNNSSFITTEITLENNDIPEYYGMDEVFSDISPRVYGLVNDTTVTKPVKLTFAHFESAVHSSFNYQINEGLDFTAEDSKYGSADSAVILYFEMGKENTEQNYFSTIYGFDDLKNEQINMPMMIQPFAANESHGFLAHIEPPVEGSIPISNRDELEQMGNDPDYPLNGSYHLVDDIDLSGEEWIPIGLNNGFTGIFDGQGHLIKNLTLLDLNANSGNGLFGYLRGTVKNVGLENINFNINSLYDDIGIDIGGICGRGYNSVITNSYITGLINVSSIESASVGGVIGDSSLCEISNCYNTSTIIISSNAPGGEAGGICGSISRTKINDCYNIGAISVSEYPSGNVIGSPIAGGICGYYLGTENIVKNCYSTGDLSSASTSLAATPYVGAICGSGSGTSIIGAGNFPISLNSCYWNIDSVQSINGSVLSNENKKGVMIIEDLTNSLPTAQMKSQSSYAGFDFNAVWKIDSLINNGLPTFLNPGQNISVSPSVLSINISPVMEDVPQGNTLQLNVEVSSQNNAPSYVEWEVLGNSSIETTVSENGLLTVSDDETAAEVTVRAISTYDYRKYDEATVRILPLVDFTASITGDGFIIPPPNKYPVDSFVSVLVRQNPATFDSSNNPTKALESIVLKGSSSGNNIDFITNLVQGGESHLFDTEITFQIPEDGVELTLTSTDAYEIDLPAYEPTDFGFSFEDSFVNHTNSYVFPNNTAVAGHDITLYLSQYGGEIPDGLVLVGQSTSQAYTIVENAGKRTTGSGGETIYAYEFVMPYENVSLNFSTITDVNHQYSIIPSLYGTSGTLNFSIDRTLLTSEAGDGLLKAAPNKTVTIEVQDINYEDNDFYGISIIDYLTGLEYSIAEVIAEKEYTFTMPSSSVYVHLDVRQKPIYSITPQVNILGTMLEMLNERTKVIHQGTASGYANDIIKFSLRNRNLRKNIGSVQLIDAENGDVLEALSVSDPYVENYQVSFSIPSRNAILNIIFNDAPSIPVTVDSAIPEGVRIIPSANPVYIGDFVNFGFATEDERYSKYRPEISVYGQNDILLYKIALENELLHNADQAVNYTSPSEITKASGTPFKIVIGVYSKQYVYNKTLESIRPNSTQAELFTEIYVIGQNMFEADTGEVYIGTSPNPTQLATVTSYGEKQLTISVPEEMKPTDNDVTYYVKINGVEKSCQISITRLLRKSPFGMLAVISNKSNTHTVIVADSEAELMSQKGTGNITLRLKGDVKYNPSDDVYEFSGGNVLFDHSATYSVASSSQPLRVYETNSGVEIAASDGKMSIPGFTFVQESPILIRLKNGVKYIDTWAKNSDGNLITKGEENIVVEYDTPLSDMVFVQNGFGVNLSNTVLLDKSVIFSGQLHLWVGTPGLFSGFLSTNSSLNIDIERLQYRLVNRNYVYEGIDASDRIAADIQLIPYFKFKAGTFAQVDINTFTNTYSVEAEVDIKLAYLYGKLVLMPLNNGILAPDEFKAVIGTTPGIPIIPGAPVGYITKGGAGFSGLVKTINGNYNAIPPLTFSLYGQFDVLKLLKFEKMTYTIGPSEISFSAVPKLLGIELFEDYYGGVFIYSDGVSIDSKVVASIIENFEVFRGGGEVNVSYRNKRFSFNGTLHAKLQIPKIKVGSIPVPKVRIWKPKVWTEWKPVNIGPITLLNTKTNLSDTGVSANFSTLGFKLKAEYKYGGRPSISLRSVETTDSLETIQDIYDENGEYSGYISFGSNLSIAALPEPREANTRARNTRVVTEPTITVETKILSGTNPDYPEEVYEDIEYEDWSDQTVTMPQGVEAHRDDYALLVTAPKNDIRITSSTGEPFILKYAEKSDGTEYTEADLNTSGINAVVVSDGTSNDLEQGDDTPIELGVDDVIDEDAVTIMIRLPKTAGEWKITSSEPFASSILKIAPLPEIEDVLFDGNNTVSWNIKNLDLDNEVYFLEIRMSKDNGSDITNTDPGVLIDEVIVGEASTASGAYVIDSESLKDFTSGNYFPRLSLLGIPRSDFESGGGIITNDMPKMPRDSKHAETPYVHVNPEQPAQIADIAVFSSGGGALTAEWQKSDDKADGYIIKVYDESGNPAYIETEVIGENENTDEMEWTQVMYDIPNDMEENGGFEVALGGLTPGASYYVEAIPYASKIVTVDGSDFQVTIEGLPAKSNLEMLPVPEYPVIYTTLPDSGDAAFDGMGNRVVYVNGDFSFEMSASQACEFTVTQDGNTIYTSPGSDNGTIVDIDMDGASASNIQISAVNDDGDISYYTFSAYLDDVPPPLFIVTDKENSIFTDQDGKYTVHGYSEQNAQITDDLGNTAQADENGEFYLSGKLQSNEDDTMRSVVASDYAGNMETADILIKNFADVAGLLESIRIIPSTEVTITVDEAFTLDIEGVLSNGDIVDIAPSAVQFNISEGGSNIYIDSNTGKITALAEGYAYLDASMAYKDAVITSDMLTVLIGANIETPKYEVTVVSEGDGSTGSGNYSVNTEVAIYAGMREGYTFDGWTTDNRVIFDDEENPSTTFTMPNNDVTVTANWHREQQPPEPSEPIVSSVAVTPGTIVLEKGSRHTFIATVTGMHNPSTDVNWTVNGGVSGTSINSSGVLTVASSETATTLIVQATSTLDSTKFGTAIVTIRQTDVNPKPGEEYTVTVNGSYNSVNGTGIYSVGEIVTINAGSRTRYNFDGWTVNSGNVTFVNKWNSSTTFIMPSGDVTVTASWERNSSRDSNDEDNNDTPRRDSVPRPRPTLEPISRPVTTATPVTEPISTPTEMPDTEQALIPLPAAVPTTESELSVTAPIQTPPQNPFMDVNELDWFYDAVMFVYQHNLMGSTSIEIMVFNPHETVTRGMLVTAIHRMQSTSEIVPNVMPFTDVSESAYYYQAVNWASLNGIVSGVGNGLFAPEAPITRQDLVVLLNNLANYAGITLPIVREYAGFTDDLNISSYAKDAVEIFFKAGLINGKDENSFDPKGVATRAEVAAILMRLNNLIK